MPAPCRWNEVLHLDTNIPVYVRIYIFLRTHPGLEFTYHEVANCLGVSEHHIRNAVRTIKKHKLANTRHNIRYVGEKVVQTGYLMSTERLSVTPMSMLCVH